MPEVTESPRVMLKEYADTLMANIQAVTPEEKDEVADDLIEINGKMEAHGKEIAELIYELLEPGRQS